MNSEIQREPSEWCRMWWSNADHSDRSRILLIGDSITVGYGDTVIEALKERCSVDYLATSRSINDPALRKETAYMLDEHSYRAIHFNNGLHGLHLEDNAYRWHLGEWVRFMQWYAPSARLAWASSTPVTVVNDVASLDAELNSMVLRRNEIAAREMAGFGIPVDDLYSIAEGKPEIRRADGLHYHENGQVLLGEAVARFIGSLLDCLP